MSGTNPTGAGARSTGAATLPGQVPAVLPPKVEVKAKKEELLLPDAPSGTKNLVAAKTAPAIQADPALARTAAVARAGVPGEEARFKATGRWVQAPSMADVASGKGVLERGMMGSSVADLQRKLNALGIQPPLAVDGMMGPLTEAALKSVQGTNPALKATLGKADAPSLSYVEGLNKKEPKDRPPFAPYRTAEVLRDSLSFTAQNLIPFSEEEMKNASPEAQEIARAARATAEKMNAGGLCATGVRVALQGLGMKFQTHNSAGDYGPSLSKNRAFVEVDVRSLKHPYNAQNLPMGMVSVFGKTPPKHEHGHIAISIGGGKEASDKIYNQTNPANYGNQQRLFLPRGTDLSKIGTALN